MKKIIKYILICCLFLTFIISVSYLNVVKAESGWDSSYDSGSSWDSGSSYDSGSSWDSGSGSGAYYSYSGGGSSILFLIEIIIVIVIIYTIYNRNVKKSQGNVSSSSNLYRELSDEEINKIDSTINKEELYKKCFGLYNDIQIAWMNFDYDNLKKYTTDELFHMYESQLKVLSAKHQKNIMSDIEFVSAKIIDINIDNGVEKVKLYLNTITRDYVVNEQNQVVRGNDKIKNNMEYIITLNRNTSKESISNCPSCGAKIDIITGGKCPYCDSIIVNNNNEFVMSKKECIGQRRI